MAPESGRSDALDHPKFRVYAATLDGETCAACAALAGLEYTPGDAQTPAIPNPGCTRERGCRCSWL